MNRWWLVIALAACNGSNASAPDAPVGATGCPPIGTSPRFAPELHVAQTHCGRYSRSLDGTLAVAACDGGTSEGPADGPFAPVAGVVPNGNNIVAMPVALYPEGDRLLVRQLDGASMRTDSIFRRTQSGWAWEVDTGVAPRAVDTGGTYDDESGNVTAGSPRHWMILETTASAGYGYRFRELVGDGASWTDVRTLDAGTDFDVRVVEEPRITPDGLRMVFRAYREFHRAAYYTDRPTIDAPFAMPVPLDDVSPNVPEQAQDPFLAPDCSRIYFTAQGAILYQEQI